MENNNIENNNEEIKLTGVEYLKKVGIKEVSNKTFIHQEELEKFLNGDFHGINKAKAMGFIQILEREFHIDLSDLKNEYLNYIQENKPLEESKPSLMMEEVKSEERKKGLFSFIFLVVAIGSIAYLIDKYDLLNFSSPADIKTAEVIDKNEVENAKINLEKLTSDVVKDTKTVDELAKEEQKEQTQQKEQKEPTLSLENVFTPEEETKTKETQTKINEEQNLQNSEQIAKEKQTDELDLSMLNSDLKEEEQLVQNQENKDENNSTTAETVQNELYIVPKSKVWIGTIDLDTLKKKDFLAPKGKRVDIDTTKNKLIMIGHKFVKIYLNSNEVKFKRKGPIRFKYIDGNLTEINRREFNKLAKGRQW